MVIQSVKRAARGAPQLRELQGDALPAPRKALARNSWRVWHPPGTAKGPHSRSRPLRREAASHPRIAQGRAIAMHGIAPSRRALSAPLPSHPSRALPPRASLPAAFRCPAHLTQVYRTPASDRNQRRNRLLPQPVSPPERQKSNVGRREKRQKGDAAGNLPRSSLAGGMGRKKWGATKRGSGTASKKQVRFPRCHSTRAATFFATPKRLRASSSGNPSTYMTSASPTPVATTPNRYMGRYSPSSAIVVNGMV